MNAKEWTDRFKAVVEDDAESVGVTHYEVRPNRDTEAVEIQVWFSPPGYRVTNREGAEQKLRLDWAVSLKGLGLTNPSSLWNIMKEQLFHDLAANEVQGVNIARD